MSYSSFLSVKLAFFGSNNHTVFEERFVLFDNFTKKSGKDIASCVIKVRDATLDVARDNIDCLMKHIQLIAQNEGILSGFSHSRQLSTQSEAE